MNVATDIQNSPYLQSLPRAPGHESLNYSRHYARQGLNSKNNVRDGWIKRLWSHVFVRKKASESLKREKDAKDSPGQRSKPKPPTGSSKREDSETTTLQRSASQSNISSTKKENLFPPINNASSNRSLKDSSYPKRPKSDSSNCPKSSRVKSAKVSSPPSTSKEDRLLSLGSDVTSGDKSHRSSLSSERKEPVASSKPPSHPILAPSRSKSWEQQPTKAGLPAELANSPYLPAKDRAQFKSVYLEKQKELLRLKEQQFKAKKSFDQSNSHPLQYKPAPNPITKNDNYSHLSSSLVDAWRTPKLPPGVSLQDLEDRAKKTATKAMREGKIFTCEVPYPMDAYVRFSMRSRGWVEKFNPGMQSPSSRGGTSSKLEVSADEDFEAICVQGVPHPWEEEHGIYAIMSRLIRHYPPRFIWGSRMVNTLTLRSEVIVNHFTKARYFSTKTGLTTSLRDLFWYLSADPNDSFPRSYLLNEEEKDDIIDDFRITACMGILKWVVKLNSKDEEKDELPPTTEEGEEEGVTDSVETEIKSESDDSKQATEQSSSEEPNNGTSNNANQSDKAVTETGDDTVFYADDEQTKDSLNGPESKNDHSAGDRLEEEDLEKQNRNLSEEKGDGDKIDEEDVEKDKEECDRSPSKSPELYAKNGTRRTRVLPQNNVTFEIKKKQTSSVSVPSQAADWALTGCKKFIVFKRNEDLDTRYSGLTKSQWEKLLGWYTRISQDGAKIKVSEAKVEECQDILKQMKEFWPQFDMDGARNIWIVKPGAKSQGKGIEFHDNLQNILKYIDNTTLQGNYVIQKYIEQPLLVYNCKFDLRQWFLVTDWTPLTIWFYKDCYLRICSQEFSYDSMHESVHLSNVSVQQYYLNAKERNENIPDDNFMNSETFKVYLDEVGAPPGVWDKVIYPGMKQACIHALMSTIDISESRKSAFELYGADFMMSEDYRPWLLEINSSPGMAPSSVDKAKLCANVVEDTIKVVLDYKESSKADTGRFELAFKDSAHPNFRCIDNKMYLKGSRIRRSDLFKYAEIDTRQSKVESERIRREKERKRAKSKQEAKAKKKAEEKLQSTASDDDNGQELEPPTSARSNKTDEDERKEDEEFWGKPESNESTEPSEDDSKQVDNPTDKALKLSTTSDLNEVKSQEKKGSSPASTRNGSTRAQENNKDSSEKNNKMKHPTISKKFASSPYMKSSGVS